MLLPAEHCEPCQVYGALCRFETEASCSGEEERQLQRSFQLICIWILTILPHGGRTAPDSNKLHLSAWLCFKRSGQFRAHADRCMRSRFEGSGPLQTGSLWEWANGDPHWALALAKGVLGFSEALLPGALAVHAVPFFLFFCFCFLFFVFIVSEGGWAGGVWEGS